MKDIIHNARPYAGKLAIIFMSLFIFGFIWLALSFFNVFGTGNALYIGPAIFFACVVAAVVVWIVFAIGQDNRKGPKVRKPTWSTAKQPTGARSYERPNEQY